MRYHNNKVSNEERQEILNKLSEFASSGQGPEFASLTKSLFKKFVPPGPKQKHLEEVALAKFLETEIRCKQTNHRVRCHWSSHGDYSSSNIIHIAKRKISDILGRFSIEQMLNLSRFGPGSTYACRGEDVSKSRKFSLKDVTPEFNSLARGLLADYPLWSNALTDSDLPICPLLDVVPGARLAFVPKDTQTDRTILVEPTINSWFQQGIGRSIRRKLFDKTGVNLDDNSLNKRLAHLGSLTDDLATIDLSSASDLISTNLVRDLLPDDWFFWLNATRSHRALVRGEWVELNKFSSMGNGFTFDLESLIFYALSWAAVVSRGLNPFWVNVFGDDIVVPTDDGMEDFIVRLFDDCGFTINRSKSYFEGPFRESCGSDYYQGLDVRGVYLKRLDTVLDLVKIHNRLWTWGNRLGVSVKHLCRFIRQFCPGTPVVPAILGDVGLFGHFDEVTPQVLHPGSESFKILTIQPIFRKIVKTDRFLLLDRLQGSEFALNNVQLRSEPIGYRLSYVASTWY